MVVCLCFVLWVRGAKLIDTLIHFLFDMLQVSALEQDIIEVDPETKEMLKHLVNELAVPSVFVLIEFIACSVVMFVV